MSEKSETQRKSALANHIAQEVPKGWRVESQGDFQAVMVKGKRPNHLLHVILSVLTAGFWLIVWLCVVVFGGEKRQMLTVDEFGNVTKQGV
ncbi:MAG: hypothetical protein OXK81_00040 [Chloroflexota bacterium]|nr:hypothetical protein [Chloroflexota bacterium]MDE2932125.1 hypothetical protein [Chloroflexota bacterium]